MIKFVIWIFMLGRLPGCFAQQKVVFPDEARVITIQWNHKNPGGEPVTFNVYRNGNILTSVRDKLSIDIKREQLGDSSTVWITALDSFGNESAHIETMTIVFRARSDESAASAESLVYEADAKKLWGWGKMGIVDNTKLSTLQELRLVGYGVPVGSRGGLTGHLVFETDGKYKISVIAWGRTLIMSIGDEVATVPLSESYRQYDSVLNIRKGTYKIVLRTIPGQDVFLKQFRKERIE